jgi:hypothetical protein
MGCFSYTCAKTHAPIMAAMPPHPVLSRVVALSADGVIGAGEYDGYGNVRLDNGDLVESIEELLFGEISTFRVPPQLAAALPQRASRRAEPTLKLVIESFFDPNTDTFAALGPNHYDPGQGFFYDDWFLDQVLGSRGFPTYEAFRAAYKASQDWRSERVQD